ncbi:P-type conjugative transfer protein TrbL [uncultured Vibrio sp.]|uniref:P-type conjugative transfer protein TrbL n=1 Tax=uncultured Vibrio sp. TaxID=114054 RepID=UPI0026201B7D|nr:P-type conjugative transfer protein TrbL [uncultured Vibrio sp.]
MIKWGVFLLSFLSPAAFASNNNALDTILDKFDTITATWTPVIIDAVMGLFWLLVTLSFTWSFIILWLHQKGFDHFVAELFERIVTVGFSLFLLYNAAPLAWTVMHSLQEVATRLSGGQEALTPSNIVEVGMVLAQRIWDSSSGFDVGQAIIIGICGLIVLVVLALIAAQLTVLIVGAFVILNGGVIMMGFLGSEWTRDHAMNYFTTVLGMAVQIFMMQLLVIIGNELFMGFIDTPSEGVADYLMMVVMSIIYYALVSTVPNMASSLTTGRFVFHSAGAVNSAVGVAGATAGLGLMAGALMKGVGGAAASKVAGTAMGQKGLEQLSNASPMVKGAMKGVGALAQGAGSVSSAAMGAMAQQSPVGRAFQNLANHNGPSKNAHQTLKKAMSPQSSSPGLSHNAAVELATQSIKTPTNHEALKTRLQQQRQQSKR